MLNLAAILGLNEEVKTAASLDVMLGFADVTVMPVIEGEE